MTKIFYDLVPSLSLQSCLTIGNFDGVHIGHQALIKRVIQESQKRNLASVVVTFDPHPLSVVKGKTPPFITLTEQKLELISQLGVDYVFCLPFNKELAQLTPKEFVKRYLVKGMGAQKIIVGYDYSFGKNKEGNFDLLKELGLEFGFEVEQVPPVIFNGEIVSSSRIRRLVQAGKVKEVRPMLNRFYQVRGTVVEGQKRGAKLLGFPTANIALKDELFPKIGVYAVWVNVLDKILAGVANIGFNPTFGNDFLSVEVHIFNFGQNIYGQKIIVHFVEYLRSEQKFASVEQLKAQIKLDVEKAKTILAQPENQIEPI